MWQCVEVPIIKFDKLLVGGSTYMRCLSLPSSVKDFYYDALVFGIGGAGNTVGVIVPTVNREAVYV